MSVPWTNRERVLLTAIRPALSTNEICQVFNTLGYTRSDSSIRKQAKWLNISFVDFGEPTSQGLTKKETGVIKEILEDRKRNLESVKALTADISTLSRKASDTKARTRAASSILKQLQEARLEVPRKGSISTRHPVNTGKQSLILMLSDWHYGLEVLDGESNTYSYNTSICSDKIAMIPGKVLSPFSKEALRSYDELVIILAGDMISGEGIFEGQAYVTETHAVEQVTNVSRLIWQVINEFRKFFPLIRVITTRGNHGRSGGSQEANWDNMIYHTLSLFIDMDGGDDLTIKNRYGQYTTADIKGWRGIIRHHAPVQADTAAGIAKFASWQMIHKWTWFGYAHWHHWGVMTVCGKPVFRNGSMVGRDEYAESLAKQDSAVQLCWGVTDEEVCTFVKPIRF